jgi:hypothetical protein
VANWLGDNGAPYAVVGNAPPNHTDYLGLSYAAESDPVPYDATHPPYWFRANLFENTRCWFPSARVTKFDMVNDGTSHNVIRLRADVEIAGGYMSLKYLWWTCWAGKTVGYRDKNSPRFVHDSIRGTPLTAGVRIGYLSCDDCVWKWHEEFRTWPVSWRWGAIKGWHY